MVMGMTLSQEVAYNDNPHLYLQLALTATLFAGLLQSAVGIFRLGFLMDFLSDATLLGFMGASAIIVSLQQLKALLGMVHFTSKMEIVPVLSATFTRMDEWAWQPFLMGAIFLAFLLTVKKIGSRRPNLFWISAGGPLLSIIISTVIVYLIRSKTTAIPTIGVLPKGVNPPSMKLLHFGGPHLPIALKAGAMVAFLSLTEGISVGRSFAAKKNYQVDGNKEMVAIGVMNLVGSFLSCFVTTGSLSRSAVNYSTGGQTAVSNIVMAASILITMLFLTPLFHYTPNVILAVIIIVAVSGLVDYRGAIHLWKVDKIDFVVALCSFIGVLGISVLAGLLISGAVAILKILLHIMRPNTKALGYMSSSGSYRSLSRYETAMRQPSFLIIGFDAPFCFANSNYLLQRTQRWIREEHERIAARNDSPLKCVVIDMAAVSSIDTSGIATLCELHRLLNESALKLALVNPIGNVYEKISKAGAVRTIGPDSFYLTVSDAVADISSSWA